MRKLVIYFMLSVILLISCQKDDREIVSEIVNDTYKKENFRSYFASDEKWDVFTDEEDEIPLPEYDHFIEWHKYKEYIERSVYNENSKDGLYTVYGRGYYHVLNGPVNVRQEPHLEGRILTRVNLHEQIEIIGHALYLQEIDNVWAGWYPVRYGDDFAYVWSGDVALESFILDVDGNGVNDYFYYRLRDIGSYLGFMDAWEDIFIYVNNERIPAKDLLPREIGWCNFSFNGVNVIIKITGTLGGFSHYYKMNINENGRIQFIKDVFPDRQQEFADRGYVDCPIIKTYRSVESTANGEYMFGVKHGMRRNELIQIFGNEASTGDNIEFALFYGYSGTTVEIKLENDRVKSILWTFHEN
jgi:hypothetical protein